MLAALTNLKVPFVEVMNSLISRDVLMKVRELPDELRSEKKAFKKIVLQMNPKVKFASSDAIASPKDILRKPELVAIMNDKFISSTASQILPETFLSKVREGIEVSGAKESKESFLKTARKNLVRIIPKGVKNAIRDSGSIAKVDNNILAFRTYIICRMNEILAQDAKGRQLQAGIDDGS